MRDEDFKHIMLDFLLDIRRLMVAMTSNQNVMDEISKLTAAHVQLEATVSKAIAEFGTGGETARAAFVTALQEAQAQIAKTEAELTALVVSMGA